MSSIEKLYQKTLQQNMWFTVWIVLACVMVFALLEVDQFTKAVMGGLILLAWVGGIVSDRLAIAIRESKEDD